jgi:hypothetical protein
MKKKNWFFCILNVSEDLGTFPDPPPDPFVRGTVRIRVFGSASGSVSKCHGFGTLI